MKKHIFLCLLALASVSVSAKDLLQLEARAHELIGQMTLEEKFLQLKNSTPGIDRLGIRPYDYWNEALHGVARTGRATVFPEPIGLAATFDPALLEAMGDAVATEGRAKYNLAQAQGNYSRYSGLTYWSPNVNIFRDPRWGRGMETYGEDPFLSGTMGSAYVRGLQGSDPVYLKAAACGKHFAVHSGPEATRHEADIYPSRRDLYETYTPAFKMLVDNGVESVMMAYNAVYGMPCPGNQLLFDILRKDFGFRGHIVSDCGAVEDIWQGHAAAKDAAEACAIAIKAGLNVECGSAFESLGEALNRGLLTEADIDNALMPLIMTRLKLGIIDHDDDCPYNEVGEEVIGCDKHIDIARRAARESMVLLKNDNVLPLRKDLHRLYVTGEGATEVYNLMGNYYGISSRYTCYLQGIASAVSAGTTIDYRPGCMLVTPESNDMNWAIGESIGNEYTIVVLGLNGNNEGEEGEAIASACRGDRATMKLPENQLNFLRRIRAHKKSGLILVLTGGSPIDMTELYDLADAIIMTWYAGQEGGLALADLIFGDANFSGRLPITFPRSVEALPDFSDYAMQGRTYKYMTDNIYFPFGYGLSYSHVRYESATILNKLSRGKLRANEDIRIAVRLTNDSDMPVTETVQAYVSAPGAGVTAPLQQLSAFSRADLAAHETRTVEVVVPADRLLVVGEDGKSVLRKGTYTIHIAAAAPCHRSAELGVETLTCQFSK